MIIAWIFVIKDLTTTIFSDFACVALKFVNIFVILHEICCSRKHSYLPHGGFFVWHPLHSTLGISVPGGHQAPSPLRNFQYLKTPLHVESILTYCYLKNDDWVAYMIVIWLTPNTSQSAESVKCECDVVSRPNWSNWKHNLDSTCPEFFFIRSVNLDAVSHKFTGGYAIIPKEFCFSLLSKVAKI